MPTYDYQCQDCSHSFEFFATIKQKEEGIAPECPACHSRATKQLFLSMMFVRGSGSSNPMPNPMTGCGPICGPGAC